MSTFKGIINEIPFISIDRFDKDNLKSKIYFLSHCHLDHMVGLENPVGLPGPLYLSPISGVIIERQYPHIKTIVRLTMGEPTLIPYTTNDGKRQSLTVTTIPAAHCPGSVMFLFEKDYHKILYTGDFRLQLKDLKKLSAFKTISGDVIKLDKIYIDSTFFDKNYLDFPTQFDSTEKICKLINEWINRGPDYIISIKTPARYGYEFVFKEIVQLCGQRIHVNASEQEKYVYIPELDNCFTLNCMTTQIHACFSSESKNPKYLPCKPKQNPKFVRIIKLSAMMWQKWQRNNDIFKEEQDQRFCVCYSTHSSYNEIRDMITYLTPKYVELNVMPDKKAEKLQMMAELSIILKSYQFLGTNDQSNETNTEGYNSGSCKFKVTANIENYAIFKNALFQQRKAKMSLKAIGGGGDEENTTTESSESGSGPNMAAPKRRRK